MKKHISPDPQKKYFCHYPRLIVVVGVSLKSKINFMPVAWSTPISYRPFLYGVSIGVDRSTHEMLSNTDYFSINFLSYKYLEFVRALGRSRGKDIDKVTEFNIDFYPGGKTGAPIMQLAYCTFECEKKDKQLYGDHTLFVGEVVSIGIDNKAMRKDGLLNIDEITPLLYLGVDSFVTLDKKSRVSLKDIPFPSKNKHKNCRG